MKLGITERRFTLEEVLKKRLFPSRIPLPERWDEYYRGKVTTREIANCSQHLLRYAA